MPPDLDRLRAELARALRCGDDATAQQIALELADLEPDPDLDVRAPRAIDAWGVLD